MVGVQIPDLVDLNPEIAMSRICSARSARYRTLDRDHDARPAVVVDVASSSRPSRPAVGLERERAELTDPRAPETLAAMLSSLSKRGQRLVTNPSYAGYIREHFMRGADAWDGELNPDGYIALCIAENRSMWDVLVPQLARYRDVPARVLGYDAMVGNHQFRRQLAAFMSRSFLGRHVAAEQLAVVAGAGAVLELVFHALADAGEGVLVPTPSYAGFWADLETRDALTIIPVHCTSDEQFRLTTAALDRALASAEQPVRALLFTTPNNPLGCVYTREQLLEVLAWAERADIHVVFDEIYALSVFGPHPFVSAASLRESLGAKVHVVWAFSKDFGASGLRCGVVVSENPELLAAVDGLAYWAACSGDTQYLLGSLVADRSFVDDYVAQMQQRLGARYRDVVSALERHGVPHLPAEAGFFLLIDLRAWLDEPSWAGEHRLWRRIVDDANVNLTPGAACRIVEPGWFRLCYASEDREAVLTGVERLGRLLAG